MKKEKIFSRDILLLMAASFFYMASPMMVTPLITGFSESLGAGALVMGLVGGLTNLCSLALQPVSGNLADRTSKYRIGCIGTAFLVIACIGYTVSLNPAMILLFRVLNGVGFAFCSVCFSTWIANLLPRDKVGYGMGLYGMMNALGMAVSPAVGVFIYRYFGYRFAFALAGIFALTCFVLIQLCRDKGEIADSGVKEKRKFQLVEKKVVPVALVIMCFAIPYCATQSFIVRYTETREISVVVGMFFTIYAVALLISRTLMRNLFDRLSFRTFFTIGSICALVSMLFLFLMKNNIEMALAAVFMAGGYGIMCTVAQSRAVTLVEEDRRGLANGTYYIGLNSGMAAGPILGGILYGNVPGSLFYPLLMITVPLSILLYFLSSRMTGKEK